MDIKLNKRQQAQLDSLRKELSAKKAKVIKLIVEGDPTPQARPRVTSIGGHVRLYDKSATTKRVFANHARKQLTNSFKPITTSLKITCRFYRSIPKSFSQVKRILAEEGLITPTTKSDIDNYEKLVFDALNGLLYVDDGLIVEVHSKKLYSENPRTEIEVEYDDSE